MATLIAKTYTAPVIASHRATCLGEQYTVATPEYTDIVTVTGDKTTCTCHEAHCEHIRVVVRRRIQDAAKDTLRAAYEAAFNLSYGDNCYIN